VITGIDEPVLSTDTMAIELREVTVRFRLPAGRYVSFKDYAIRRLRRQVDFHEFLALDRVSLNVAAGETVGVIGRNGAGKSTLMKVIARVRRPSSGQVIVRGDVAPLLELGAAFHPELSGRENAFLNATLLGHKQRDVAERFAEIVAFSELEEFIDAPLRAYSSGMVARLGFALATTWRPKILLIDELLAVGDEAFQAKCRKRIGDFRSQGVTVVIVSHSAELLKELCSRVVWIERGRVAAEGDPSAVVAAYHASSAPAGVVAATEK
jgi:ABC-type polysaccharide/polyol phosphate transport system ATPase subunit